MAKVNSKEYYDTEELRRQCGLCLLVCLPDEELKKLRSDYHQTVANTGQVPLVPFWSFALENIKVSYQAKEK